MQNILTFSAPPFENSLQPLGKSLLRIKVVILFLFESNGNCLLFPSTSRYLLFSTLIGDLNLYKKSMKALSVLFFVSHTSLSPLISGSFSFVILESTFNAMATFKVFQYFSLLKRVV